MTDISAKFAQLFIDRDNAGVPLGGESGGYWEGVSTIDTDDAIREVDETLTDEEVTSTATEIESETGHTEWIRRSDLPTGP